MEQTRPRLTEPTFRVLGALLSSPTEELSGADITRMTKMPSGTLYPILFRLERANWVESRWEAGDPKALGRPRRRYYRITGIGAKSAHAVMNELSAAFVRLAWS